MSGVAGNPAGHIQIKRKTEGLPSVYAHRLSWELANGPIPDGLNVLHNCPGGDNPRCVRPEHLFLGTQGTNVHDAILKGRRNAFGIQKLHPPQVLEIRALADERRLTYRAIAERFGVARSTVRHIAARRAWAWLEEQFEPVPSPPQHLDRALYGPNGPFEFVPSIQLPIAGEVR